jgi:hypothetical protein
MSRSSRIALLALTCAVAFGAALSSSGVAHAQAAVNSPFGGSSVCLAPSDVTGELADPNAYYAGSPNCKALCRKAETDCAQYVKLASTCQKLEIDDDASYAKKECEVENEHGVATTTCKNEIEHGARDGKSAATDDKNSALDVCDKWESDCEKSCPHP